MGLFDWVLGRKKESRTIGTKTAGASSIPPDGYPVALPFVSGYEVSVRTDHGVTSARWPVADVRAFVEDLARDAASAGWQISFDPNAVSGVAVHEQPVRLGQLSIGDRDCSVYLYRDRATEATAVCEVVSGTTNPPIQTNLGDWQKTAKTKNRSSFPEEYMTETTVERDTKRGQR